jgi:hypothetical protein
VPEVYRTQGIERYHQAALLLLKEKGGSFTLSSDLYNDFHGKIRDLLKAEDYEPFPSEPGPRWKTSLRLALWHMRIDGRVKWYGHARYEITEKGEEYLRDTPLHLRLLTEEVEFRDDGEIRMRYLLSDGSVECEFSGSGRDDHII